LSANGQPIEHLDVLIVGAGISGVGAAYHLNQRCPARSYAIFEAREDLGGTWDLFRYPGIRSDSDMHTLGYRFKPWTDEQAIADGGKILDYVRETARENGIEQRIRYGLKVVRAEWSTADSRWTVEAERSGSGETVRLTCGYLWTCTGYYRYDEGYTPEFEGVERFSGRVVHPQHWPEDLDYAGKRVVVIGSGATAVTLVPAMAKQAAQVTMLQRSPTYIVAMPGEDPIAKAVRRVLPLKAAYAVIRWKNVLLQQATYTLSKRRPSIVKKLIRRGNERMLPPGYDIDTHFKPSYNPWDQRMCLVPNGDLFESIRSGEAEIVTDRIEAFTEKGLKLESGVELKADVIITATGLNVLFLGGMEIAVDGEAVDFAKRMAYKGMMLNGIPNFAFTLGYTNASWTLKADLVSEYICRLLNHMDAHGYRRAVPEVTDPSVTEEPILDFNSGYVLRALDRLPKQGSKEPWKLRQNYLVDTRAIRRAPIDDGAMQFSGAAPREQRDASLASA
jgi:monooxygenase